MISMKKISNYENKQINGNDDNDTSRVHLSKLIGNFGWFQLYITLFSALRETTVAFDVVVMSAILSKSHRLSPSCCNLTMQLEHNMTGTTTTYRPLIQQNNETIPINSMIVTEDCSLINEKNSLLSSWNLQCNNKNDWYIALIETSYLVGFIPGNLILGYCSDRFGRTKTYLISHLIALLGGSFSLLTTNYWLFVLSRFITAFGSCGFNIIYTISLELVGIKYRALNTCLNHFGWGLGVLLVPFIDRLFSSNYKYTLAFCPILSSIMLIIAYCFLPESPLWLLTNDKQEEAKKVLYKIVKFNNLTDNIYNREDRFNQNISSLHNQIKEEQRKQNKSISSRQKHRILFTNSTFRRDTLILAYTGSVIALFYYVLILNFSYVQNLSPEANFISSGVGEWIGVLFCILLLKFSARKFCFGFIFIILAVSFSFQFYIDFYHKNEFAIIVMLNNGIGSIFDCSLIFLLALVSMEILPTNLRNTGSSIIDTTTHCGSAFAPVFIQIGRLIGNDKTSILYAILSLIGAIATQFLSTTDNIELSDV